MHRVVVLLVTVAFLPTAKVRELKQKLSGSRDLG